MAPPPPPELSPKKRARMTDSDTDNANVHVDADADVFFDATQDPVQTPRSITSTLTGIHSGMRHYGPVPIFSKPSATATTGMSSSGRSDGSPRCRSRRSRPTNPIKNPNSLDSLAKPVLFTTRNNNNLDNFLPEDVRGLYDRLADIAISHRRVIPRPVSDMARAVVGEKRWMDHWVDDAAKERGQEMAGDTDTVTERAKLEFAALRQIEKDADLCRSLGRSEVAWNAEVHLPLLKLALGPQRPGIRAEYIPSAQIASPFLPAMATANVSASSTVSSVASSTASTARSNERGKEDNDDNNDGVASSRMVDFALVLDPAAEANDDPLAAAIGRFLVSQPRGWESVNQSCYRPLRRCPIGVNIETKGSGGTLDEGRVQLGVWIAAWHRRMETALAARPQRVVTQPLVLVVEHQWTLSFACDLGDRIEVVGDLTIGESKTLFGLFSIVACLRALADWMDGPFREWLCSAFAAAAVVT